MGLKHGQGTHVILRNMPCYFISSAGILRLPNAEMYDGSWNEDKKHGYGSYNYCNGECDKE